MIDIKPIDLSPLAEFCAIFHAPHDDIEIALARHCAKHPYDETAALVHADRLDELDRPFLAAMERSRAAKLAFQRNVMNAMIQSLCVPAHFLAPPSPGDFDGSAHRPHPDRPATA